MCCCFFLGPKMVQFLAQSQRTVLFQLFRPLLNFDAACLGCTGGDPLGNRVGRP
eukprot:m.276503 g.276503  ORF g.276503 m.276503 type:complete len:54 (-) comp16144_c0_seq2:2445-2606(-)